MAVALGACLAAAPAPAQTLLSSPPHAELRLDGPVRVIGPSPLMLEEPLRGEYLLTAEKPGFVVQKARLRFPEGGGPARPAGSGPFSGVSGVIRTLALPGVGQMAAGERGHGWVMLLTEAGALGMVIKSDADARHALNDYNSAYDRLQAAAGTTVTAEEQTDLEIAVRRAQYLQDDARASRRRWLVFAGLTWGYSVLDQAFLRGGLDVRTHGFDTLRVTLQPVSRTQAVLRSALVPGAGQAYAGHRGRGAWLLLFTGGLTSVALAGEHHFDRTLSEQAEAQARYDALSARTSDVDRLNSARDALQQRYSDASSARRTRTLLWAAAGTAWVLNILDAMVMDIPGADGRTAALDREGMYAQVDPGSVRLGFRRGF
ncbi:MAG: hypothetical protein HZB25_05320 [Candidatus Eisenbacteria bacterium]|nr:hypothetical protein [Candidatus Eisenbacteria bacterium]